MTDHTHGGSGDAANFTLRTYLTGFAVAAVMTAAAFWIVMARPFSATVAAVIVVMLAIAQIIVQTRAFLHVNARAQGGWILVAYVFTAFLLLTAIGGSLWIMYHLDSNMMPGMMIDPMSQVP
jgi:cytochrome o ubiquinol oxidase subunit IV